MSLKFDFQVVKKFLIKCNLDNNVLNKHKAWLKFNKI